jgi:hypothetical protein
LGRGRDGTSVSGGLSDVVGVDDGEFLLVTIVLDEYFKVVLTTLLLLRNCTGKERRSCLPILSLPMSCIPRGQERCSNLFTTAAQLHGEGATVATSPLSGCVILKDGRSNTPLSILFATVRHIAFRGKLSAISKQ